LADIRDEGPLSFSATVDEDTTLWPACDLGNLRVALNALVRAFGMRG
jgi:hypothetical protein